MHLAVIVQHAPLTHPADMLDTVNPKSSIALRKTHSIWAPHTRMHRYITSATNYSTQSYHHYYTYTVWSRCFPPWTPSVLQCDSALQRFMHSTDRRQAAPLPAFSSSTEETGNHNHQHYGCFSTAFNVAFMSPPTTDVQLNAVPPAENRFQASGAFVGCAKSTSISF